MMLLRLSLLLVASATRSLAQQQPPQYPRAYHLWSSQEIHSTIQQLGVDYPQFVRVSTSQASFGLPVAGSSSDCPFDASVGCPNYYAVVQDFAVHPEGSDSSARLPAVLLSGALHGDERVGPTTVMETLTLLLQAAACEATIDTACRSELATSHGISTVQRQWLARLVTTRRIVVVPTANALGYFRNTRNEGSYDPNRDFPFDATSADSCMRTLAGRTLNELFLDNIFQLCFTFHAGIEMITYEWGAFPYLQDGSISPDDRAQDILATSLADYGGSWSGTPTYRTGPSNLLLYAIHGGMEDWAYAGSWETQFVQPCTPSTYGGYPTGKTQYNSATLRAFNLLVETSSRKTPVAASLGTNQNVLLADNVGAAGHVARNIRLSMAAIDLVEPYAVMQRVAELDLVDDIVPGVARNGCGTIPTIAVPTSRSAVDIAWTVGGALSIEETQLWVARAADVDDDVLNDCLLQPDANNILGSFAAVGGSQNGRGLFSSAGAQPSDSNTGADVIGPKFSTVVNLANLGHGNDDLYVMVSARVDADWATTASSGLPAGLPPQAHLANVRTNPSWYHQSAGKIVEGRLIWFSLPIRLVRSSDGSGVVHVNSRFQGSPVPEPFVPSPTPQPPTGGDVEGTVFCFSGETTVQTGEGALVKMKDLRLGDTIQTWTGDQTFDRTSEPVYSFGHYHPDMVGEFLRIQPSNLELSKHHLIYAITHDSETGRFVPAGMLQLGDEIFLEGKAVPIANIETVQRRGVYAPFTPTGTLYVNGVLVSSFVALDLKVDSPYLTVGSVTTPWTHHWIAHSFETLHRNYCWYVGDCRTERYTDEGLSTWIAFPFRGFLRLKSLHEWIETTAYFFWLILLTRLVRQSPVVAKLFVKSGAEKLQHRAGTTSQT